MDNLKVTFTVQDETGAFNLRETESVIVELEGAANAARPIMSAVGAVARALEEMARAGVRIPAQTQAKPPQPLQEATAP